MKKGLEFIIIPLWIIIIMVLFSGCGAKESGSVEGKDEVGNEALEIAYSYQKGEIDANDAMTQLIVKSHETKNEELGKAIEQVGLDIGAESFAGAARTKNSIENLEVLLGVKTEKSNSSNALEIAQEVNSWLSDEYNPLLKMHNMAYDGLEDDIDVEYEILLFNDEYNKRDEMIEMINTLSDDDYSMMKVSFNKALAEIDKFYDLLQDEVFVGKILASKNTDESVVDTDALYDYISGFTDKYTELLQAK